MFEKKIKMNKCNTITLFKTTCGTEVYHSCGFSPFSFQVMWVMFSRCCVEPSRWLVVLGLSDWVLARRSEAAGGKVALAKLFVRPEIVIFLLENK